MATGTLVQHRRRNSTTVAANVLDPECAADAAGLRYVSDESPGIRRRRFGRGFAYYDPDGKKITSRKVIDRINALAIPPAYKDVWICPYADGHLQATGRDDRGRKQYRYHEQWGEVRDRAKFGKLEEFSRVLPKLRRTVNRHLRAPGLGREKVLAACVKLLDKLYIRIGNDEYATRNDTYGLTTLQDDHARFGRNGRIRLEFPSKHGIEREAELTDSRLAKIVKQCQDLPGQELLQYVDNEGNVVDIGSADVNDYLREYAGPDITAKDFRTWHATVLAATALRDEVPAKSKTARNKQIISAVDQVARNLGNTRAICRKCYIHPLTLNHFDKGELQKRMEAADPVPGLSKDESATLELLKAR